MTNHQLVFALAIYAIVQGVPPGAAIMIGFILACLLYYI